MYGNNIIIWYTYSGNWGYCWIILPLIHLKCPFNKYIQKVLTNQSKGHGTVQYSTVQYSTVQYSTVQYSSVQYSSILYADKYLILNTQYMEIWEEN